MKIRALESFRKIASDRVILAFIVAIILFAGAYVVYVIFSLHPTELQVATHYTVFGETNFYRNKWYYLISFVLFGILIAIAHTSLIIKLFFYDLRSFAISFAWLTLLLIAVTWIITHSVLSIAFLS
ncbi:MAG: hypothetical protein ABJA64_00095 [Candidatus Saccharibacteria bacterium]